MTDPMDYRTLRRKGDVRKLRALRAAENKQPPPLWKDALEQTMEARQRERELEALREDFDNSERME